jgi:uncharacterized RDD family membrane protein YckC
VSTPAASGGEAAALGLARRLACFLYEGVLLFGVVMVIGLAYGITTGQRHALMGTLGLQFALFVALGAYFVYFWAWHGQTLAMKTWRIALVAAGGGRVGIGRAVARYLLAWLWFVPALAALRLADLHGGAAIVIVTLAGVLGYAALALLRADRQFWHDVVCGTRLVDRSKKKEPT